jgi:hypothetical protein
MGGRIFLSANNFIYFYYFLPATIPTTTSAWTRAKDSGTPCTILVRQGLAGA